ncbi:MAG: FAD-dependent oxidoreductase, partial [Nitriliruptoraceae bacterium]
LFERGPSLLANFPPGAQAATLRRFRRRGVTVHLDTPVCRLTTHGLDTGRRWHAHDVAVLATGLVAHPDVERMGLGGHDGIPVDETLQHVSYDDIYAVGDCAHRVDAPLPKIGVYAVRQGPVLVESLLARRRGDALPRFAAADHVLQIVDLGDGTAVAARGRRWFAGRLPRVVKRRIDRRWLDRYRC